MVEFKESCHSDIFSNYCPNVIVLLGLVLASYHVLYLEPDSLSKDHVQLQTCPLFISNLYLMIQLPTNPHTWVAVEWGWITSLYVLYILRNDTFHEVEGLYVNRQGNCYKYRCNLSMVEVGWSSGEFTVEILYNRYNDESNR
jgi:hypothetical protein